MRLIVQNKKNRLIEILKGDILKGKYKKGDKLPSTVSLSRSFGVTKETINTAMSHLVSEGFLYREQGKGSFVCFEPLQGRERYKTIGIYLGSLGSALTPEEAPGSYAIFHGVNNIAEKRGYNTLIVGKKNTEINLEKLRNTRMDGLVICGVSTQGGRKLMRLLSKTDIPYISMDRDVLDEEINYVEAYAADEICKATEYLIGLGHERIACIGYIPASLATQNSYSGFEKALKGKGIYNSSYIKSVRENTEAELLETVKNLYTENTPPSAVFLFRDDLIEPFLAALKKHNIGVPQDCSLMVRHEEKVTAKNGLEITTVGGISKVKFGETAAEALIDVLEGKATAPVNKKLQLKIIEGNSIRKR